VADDLSLLVGNLGRWADSLTGKQMRVVLDVIGVEAKKDAAEAFGRSRPGVQFSGWQGPEPMAARYALHRDGQGITVHRAPGSAGPIRVAEEGRNQGNASGFQGPGANRTTGSTARTKSGAVRKVRARQAVRWNGRTTGFRAWTQAEELIVARTPDRALKALVDQGVKVMLGGRS